MDNPNDDFIDVGYHYQLTLNNIIEHAARLHPKEYIVYRGKQRETYKEVFERCKRLSNALEGLDVKEGTRVIEFEWNSHRHLEMYFAIPSMGGILHLGNPLLTPEQIAYIINHAGDEVLIVNKDFLPLIDGIKDKIKTVKHFILITDDGEIPETRLDPVYEYEDLLKKSSSEYRYPDLDENTVATMCYTTGTTGDPKGCWFTHRALSIHSIIWGGYASGYGLTPAPYGATLCIVPMFHVHGWCIPYMSTLFGIRQLMIGRTDPTIVLEMIKNEKKEDPDRPITIFGVASVLRLLIYHPEIEKYRRYLGNVRYIVGGTAFPRGLAERCIELGIDPYSGWGMTETCPVMGLTLPKSHMRDWPDEKILDFKLRSGWAAPFEEQRVVDAEGRDVPRDNKTIGEIVLRSPWCTMGYYKDLKKSKDLWKDGWLHTGDLALMDEEENPLIVDRDKDVVKSGGEWISTLTLEDILSKYPKVSEVAVIGVPHKRYEERPVAIIVPKNEFKDEMTEDELRRYLEGYVEDGKILKWWIPERFIFIDEIPKTSVGKFDKKALRPRYKDLLSNSK